MNAFEAIKNRRSIRNFESRPISDESLEKLKLAALSSPSAMDRQPWKFVFVSNQDLIAEITKLTVDRLLGMGDEAMNERLKGRNYSIFYNAPTIVFIFADKDNPWSPIDCGIAVENLAVEACSDGLGSCIIGLVKKTFEEHPELYEKLGIDREQYKFYISLAVGYAAMTKPAHELKFEKVSFLD